MSSVTEWWSGVSKKNWELIKWGDVFIWYLDFSIHGLLVRFHCLPLSDFPAVPLNPSVLNSLGDCFPFCLRLMLLLISTANGILCLKITGLHCMNLLNSIFFMSKVLGRCMPLGRNKKWNPIILALLNTQMYDVVLNNISFHCFVSRRDLWGFLIFLYKMNWHSPWGSSNSS